MGALITEDHLQKVLGFMDIAKKEVGIFSCIAIHGCICTFGKLFLVVLKSLLWGSDAALLNQLVTNFIFATISDRERKLVKLLCD